MEKNKFKAHIEIGQYQFVEFEDETLQGLLEKTLEVKTIFNQKDGLKTQDWNSALDEYLSKNTLHSETYANMNEWQKTIIQEIKRSAKRLEYKNNK